MHGRTKRSLLNIVTALIGQVLAILFGFLTRMVFVRQLGDAYVGVNGLFTSIVGLLSLAELGIGESINYKLYKPLAENHREQIKSLMKLYRTVYRVIGLVILAIGAALLPFLPLFLKASDVDAVERLPLIFSLFVINSAASFFFSYKRALIISDQKRYIVTLFHYAFYCLMSLGQILILIKTQNFVLYLLIMLLCTVGQNVLISARADRMYPFLRDRNVKPLQTEDVTEIRKNTLALLFHKVGSQVVNSTDNILASKLIGLVTVGIYSNYLLVTSALSTIVAQLFAAITASVGNLGAIEDRRTSETVMMRVFFGNFWFVTVICAAFYSSIEILVTQMFGDARVLSHGVLLCIVINFFLYNIRRTAWTFRDGYGLFWYDRYKALAEAGINLVVSVFLGKKLGLTGILLGTIISTAVTSLWIEPYILYKYAFQKRVFGYYLQLGKYTAVAGAVSFGCRQAVALLRLHGYPGFLIGCVFSAAAASAVIAALFWRTEELCYYRQLLRGFLNRQAKNGSR